MKKAAVIATIKGIGIIILLFDFILLMLQFPYQIFFTIASILLALPLYRGWLHLYKIAAKEMPKE